MLSWGLWKPEKLVTHHNDLKTVLVHFRILCRSIPSFCSTIVIFEYVLSALQNSIIDDAARWELII